MAKQVAGLDVQINASTFAVISCLHLLSSGCKKIGMVGVHHGPVIFRGKLHQRCYVSPESQSDRSYGWHHGRNCQSEDCGVGGKGDDNLVEGPVLLGRGVTGLEL